MVQSINRSELTQGGVISWSFKWRGATRDVGEEMTRLPTTRV
jgi:hypothetical protein